MGIPLNKFATASLQQWLGKNPIMRALKNTLIDFAKGDCTLFLAGEIGTDKELIAQTIHNLSSRHKSPFISINCRTIPTELIESELLGNESGAFVGSTLQHIGRFELADEGTVFLDEIDALPLSMQNKLLDILQHHTFKRIGSDHAHGFKARIIAASKTSTSSDINKKLFELLNVCVINVPPLRRYISDLPELLDYFSEKIITQNKAPLRFTKNALIKLTNYPWPGNRVELRSFIENMLVCFPHEIIDVSSLPKKYQLAKTSTTVEENNNYLNDTTSLPLNNPFDLKKYLLDVEFSLIKKTAEKFNGNISHTAKFLHIGRTTLIEKIRKHNLSQGENKRDDLIKIE